jgi:hypothetical protein
MFLPAPGISRKRCKSFQTRSVTNDQSILMLETCYEQ